MALPTGTLSGCSMCVQLSTNGTSWTDYSDYLTVIEAPEMTRTNSSLPVFGEDTHILGYGKKEPFQVRIRGAYVDSTATTNPFSYVWAQWTSTCGGALAVRWAPAGCATTNQVFSTATATTHQCKVISMMVPGGDAASADPLVWEAVILADDLFRATWAA